MRIRVLIGAALLSGLSLVPSSGPMRAQGQAPATPPPTTDGGQPTQPSFRVEANFVRVDVYPTHADGTPVTDLTANDFELLEDGKPQAVTQFEHVALSTTTAREERRDPVSADDGRRQAADPRRRVYVIFLDMWHSTFEGAVRARRPIVDMLERLIGPDDLFAVMTPDMDPRQISFARRTETIDEMLTRHTRWGMQDMQFRIHPEEQQLEICYPENHPGSRCPGPGGQTITQPANAYRGVAPQLIRRRREDESLTALENLVRYLGGVREERKALITVTSGYEMFEPKPELLQQQECQQVPSLGRVGTGPDGRVTTDTRSAQSGPLARSSAECFALAMKYASLNNRQRFIALTQEANRYNVSFYPFDTRGLAVFDRGLDARDERLRNDSGEWYNRISGNAPGSLSSDGDRLRVRLDSMRLLAENTDGIAVLNTNNLAEGARRIVQDLSSYYLLGYYSTNDALDGRWRTIRVRVKRPGVQVRARKGYRALRAEDMVTATSAARTAAAGGAGDAVATAEGAALAAAIGSVAGLRDGQPWRSRAAWFFHAGGGATARTGTLWLTADLEASAIRDASLAQGGTLSVTVSSAAGQTVAQGEVPLAPGARSATAALETSTVPLEAGELLVRLRLAPAAGGLPLTDAARLALPAADTPAAGPRLARASPQTRQQFIVTADPRYRRGEKIRVEVPVAPGATGATAVLLDQAGKVMAAVPVAATLDPPDSRGIGWAMAAVSLAPLAPGDYVVRVEVAHPDGDQRVFAGFKVVP
jgi:VWFA-related protein